MLKLYKNAQNCTCTLTQTGSCNGLEKIRTGSKNLSLYKNRVTKRTLDAQPCGGLMTSQLSSHIQCSTIPMLAFSLPLHVSDTQRHKVLTSRAGNMNEYNQSSIPFYTCPCISTHTTINIAI